MVRHFKFGNEAGVGITDVAKQRLDNRNGLAAEQCQLMLHLFNVHVGILSARFNLASTVLILRKGLVIFGFRRGFSEKPLLRITIAFREMECVSITDLLWLHS